MCKCHSIKKLVGGGLLLVNAFLWPQWLGVDGWVKYVAVLMVLAGFLHLVMPACKDCHPVCNTEKAMPAKKGKK